MPVDTRVFSTCLLWLVASCLQGAEQGELVSIERVSTNREYSIGPLGPDARIYVDRNYAVEDAPDALVGFAMVRTSNEDDRVRSDPHLTLRVHRQAAVYVCWDDRAYRPAEWLRGWQRVKGRIITEDTSFDIYRKAFQPGLVKLGGNSRQDTGASSNYFVVVTPIAGTIGLEHAGVVDDTVLSVRPPQTGERGDGNENSRPMSKSPLSTRPPKLPAGFSAKLFAREPMIHNPCALCFDAKGRMTVGFGPQYRSPRPDTPGDQVVFLIDDNDDGVADRKQVFGRGFNSIQGLAWNGDQLWVANAPELTMVRDSDGDDVADEYVRIYADLGNLEHGLHGLRWGPDGKLYMSKGNSKGHNQPEKDGRVAPREFRELFGLAHPAGFPDHPAPVHFTSENYFAEGKGYHDPSDDWGRQGGVLRCGTMGQDLEIISRGFRNPWDIAFDDGFNWLGTDNDQDQGDKIFTPFHGAHFGWSHPWSYEWNDFNHTPTVPASAPLFEGSGPGVAFYTGTQFPQHLRNVFFINDWLSRATYVYRFQWKGAIRQPVDEDQALVAFAIEDAGGLYKPTDIEVGPDGALYVCSWGVEYGAEWKPDEVNQTQINEGRIYRISFRDNPLPKRSSWSPPKRDRPVEDWSVQELIDDLGPSSLPVWRVNAQRELVRRGPAVSEELIKVLRDADRPAQLQTWVVWALGRAAPDDKHADAYFSNLLASSADRDRGNVNLRVQALRILRHRATSSAKHANALPSAVADALGDVEPRIRFEAVQAIWQSHDRNKLTKLWELVASENDRLTFYAAWQALRDLATLQQRKAMLDDPRPGVRFAALLGLMDAFEVTKQEVLRRVESEPDPRIQQWGLKWVLAGSPPRTVSNQKERVGSRDNLQVADLVTQLEKADNVATRRVIFKMLTRLRPQGDDWQRVRQIHDKLVSSRPGPNDAELATMIQVLSGDRQSYPLMWDALLHESETVHSAAVNGFARDPAGRRFLLAKLSAHADVRQQAGAVMALARFIPRENSDAALHIDDAAASRLEALFREHSDPRVRGASLMALAHAAPEQWSTDTNVRILRLAQLAAKEADPRIHAIAPRLARRLGGTLKLVERSPAAIEDILPLIANADPVRGEAIFADRQRANCLNCHRVGSQGTDFAPSLSDIGRRSNPREILESILHPGRKITEGFAVTHLITDTGHTISGVIRFETASTLRVFRADGTETEVQKDSVEERVLSKDSVMPANFGSLLAKDELADVVAWLMTKQAQVAAASTRLISESDQVEPEATPSIEFSRRPDQIVITANGHALGTYVFSDPKITRPYLANVFAPGGIQVTRNHPPQPGDPTDHADYHPGIFLAFGDISGHDYWRLRAKVVHDGFQQLPQSKANVGSFVVRNRYVATGGEETICHEVCKLTFEATPRAYHVVWDSSFSSPQRDFYFGDQEEMGLAARVASPIREAGGNGRILSSEGLSGAKNTWGKPASWCDYSGTIHGEPAGITLMADPRNPRPSWWHNRDYGVFVANLFGREAMRQGGPSKLHVKRGETLRLRYGIVLHASRDSPPDPSVVYQRFVDSLESKEQ